MRRIKTISILALTLLVLTPLIVPDMETAFAAEKAPEYQVYIVHYGTSDSYPMPYLMYLGSAAENVPMDWAFWRLEATVFTISP